MSELGKALGPMMRRIGNMLARGSIASVNAANKMQGLQVRLLAGEVKDGVEHFEPYGFTAHPLGGAEALAAFFDGDRSHGVVTRAWVYPSELGLGTVTLRFVRDNDASLIPDAGEIATVQAYIDARRPVTAAVTVAAPVAVPLNFTITGLTPATAAVQAAVQAELSDLLLREATPGGTILLSHLRAAISSATGETDYVLTTPSANVTHTTGQMATMGTITWA